MMESRKTECTLSGGERSHLMIFHQGAHSERRLKLFVEGGICVGESNPHTLMGTESESCASTNSATFANSCRYRFEVVEGQVKASALWFGVHEVWLWAKCYAKSSEVLMRFGAFVGKCWVALSIACLAAQRDKLSACKLAHARRISPVYLFDRRLPLSASRELAQQSWARHRLRLQPSMEVGSISVQMELDVLSGQVFGTTHTVGAAFEERRHTELGNPYAGWTTLEPRQMWIEIKGPFLSIRFGQMKSAWGLGLLSDEMDWRQKSFVGDLRKMERRPYRST